ncbi:MAG TPA: type II toxin-antitoxin system VapC family toxin [Candidatus Solibacter sp.]|nr:type II toxin-antitoxin system VapC family toxin [Candidatus Solibacter sp.]
MRARFLLDTNICIYIRQKKAPEVMARFRTLEAGKVAMSVITQGELLYGAERSQQREVSMRALEELAALIPPLALPEEAGAEYGRIRVDLERRELTIGNNDLWIAAHAKAGKFVLVTNNEKEFRRIGGLRVENWASRK